VERYPLPWEVLAPLVGSILSGKRREFREDAQKAVRLLKTPPRWIELACAPQSGPGVVTVNHYIRPGLPAWWFAMAISAELEPPVDWVISARWGFEDSPLRGLLAPLSQRIICRVAQVYGFTTMPPMPPRPDEVKARAKAVRRVLRAAQQQPDRLIGFAPEGRDSPDARLIEPPAGVGRFLLRLSEMGLPLYPVGVFEEGGGLCVRFGKAYRLEPGEDDSTASRVVMERIAMLLPAGMRGDYSLQ